jgi:DNA-binding LytR/AlgR family response regulator
MNQSRKNHQTQNDFATNIKRTSTRKANEKESIEGQVQRLIHLREVRVNAAKSQYLSARTLFQESIETVSQSEAFFHNCFNHHRNAILSYKHAPQTLEPFKQHHLYLIGLRIKMEESQLELEKSNADSHEAQQIVQLAKQRYQNAVSKLQALSTLCHELQSQRIRKQKRRLENQLEDYPTLQKYSNLDCITNQSRHTETQYRNAQLYQPLPPTQPATSR